MSGWKVDGGGDVSRSQLREHTGTRLVWFGTSTSHSRHLPTTSLITYSASLLLFLLCLSNSLDHLTLIQFIVIPSLLVRVIVVNLLIRAT